MTTPTFRINSNKTVAVSTSETWREIDSDTPTGVKLLLINKQANTTHVAEFNSKDNFFTHWAPLPAWP